MASEENCAAWLEEINQRKEGLPQTWVPKLVAIRLLELGYVRQHDDGNLKTTGLGEEYLSSI